MYLKTQSFCMLSTTSTGTACAYIRKKTSINLKQTHASGAIQNT